MVSPETRLCVSPSSKAACAAISKIQSSCSYPNSLRERWSICLRASALSSSKVLRVLLGREDLATRASRPLGYFRGMLAPRARQKHLASAHGESVFGAQPSLEGFTLRFGERTYKDWSLHGAYCNSQHETYLEDALAPLCVGRHCSTRRSRAPTRYPDLARPNALWGPSARKWPEVCSPPPGTVTSPSDARPRSRTRSSARPASMTAGRPGPAAGCRSPWMRPADAWPSSSALW